MRVYNLTPDTEIDYRGHRIPPNGGFADLRDLTFLPDRDKQLEKDRVLAFGALPPWFQPYVAPVVVQEPQVIAPVVFEPTVLDPVVLSATSELPKKAKR